MIVFLWISSFIFKRKWVTWWVRRHTYQVVRIIEAVKEWVGSILGIQWRPETWLWVSSSWWTSYQNIGQEDLINYSEGPKENSSCNQKLLTFVFNHFHHCTLGPPDGVFKIESHFKNNWTYLTKLKKSQFFQINCWSTSNYVYDNFTICCHVVSKIIQIPAVSFFQTCAF